MPEVDFDNLGTGIVVVKNNKVLLGKRLGNSYLSGVFGIPGGRVKIGEELEKSAIRELFEETNLKTSSLQFVGVVNDNRRQKTFIHLVFACQKFTGKLKTMEPDKCEEWKWFDLKDLPEDILPGHKAGIEMYLNKKKRIIELV